MSDIREIRSSDEEAKIDRLARLYRDWAESKNIQDKYGENGELIEQLTLPTNN